MDIGTIVIHVTSGRPVVSRCEEAPTGIRLLPAANAAALAAQATLALDNQGVSLNEEGLYLSSDELQAAAIFPPMELPADAITYGAARTILYPDMIPNTGWQRVRRDVESGKLRVWRVGIGQDRRQYVSRADIMRLVDKRTVPALV